MEERREIEVQGVREREERMHFVKSGERSRGEEEGGGGVRKRDG